MTAVMNPSGVSDSRGGVFSALNHCCATSRRTRLLGHSMLAGRSGQLMNSDVFCSHVGNCNRTFSGIIVSSFTNGAHLANSCACCGRIASSTCTARHTITVSCSRNSDLFVRNSALHLLAHFPSASSMCHVIRTCRGMHVCHRSMRTMYSSVRFDSLSSYVAVCCSPII